MAKFFGLNYPLKLINIILPLGLSFYTFQSLSYLIEVYRKKQKAEKKLAIYALYIMFFPKLIAGPIERPQHLLGQFYEKHQFDYARVSDGLKLMAWGVFQKVVIADRLAIIVNNIYNNPANYDGLTLLIATILFAFQIYCDFAGYSDIAIGSAQIMGFDLIKNFNRPYFAKSISEFWSRWHISLTIWLRDYIYIPLGGNRVSRGRNYFNLLMTFLLSGLWHGANWTYIVWGAVNGFYLIFSKISQNTGSWLNRVSGLLKQPFLDKLFKITTTFALVCLAWIFFRANNLKEAFYIIGKLPSSFNLIIKYLITFDFLGLKDYWRLLIVNLGNSRKELLIALMSIITLLVVQLIQRKGSVRQQLRQKPLWFRWLLYYALMAAIIFLGIFGQKQFIYFQF